MLQSDWSVYVSTCGGKREGSTLLRDYLALARPQYWVKNVLILPGAISAVAFGLGPVPYGALLHVIVATSLIASANYVINGWYDAASDHHHPVKRARPAARGTVALPGVVAEYVLLAAAGLGIAWFVSRPVFVSLAGMLIVGAAYNIPPVRLKDISLADTLSESVGDVIRLLVGWFAVAPAFLPPVSLVLGYWMGGAFLVTVKRLAEYRALGDRQTAASYRRSFARYTSESLAVAALTYAMAASFFLGVFLVRYRFEYLLAMPAIWALFGWYFAMGFRKDSQAQRPETLWRDPPLMLLAALVVVLLLTFTVVDVPALKSLSDTSLDRVPHGLVGE